MTVDVDRSLITYIWNLLTTDGLLKALMGGTVRCYPVDAVEDAEFPYLVHRLDIRQHPGTHGVQNATHYLDIWSDSPNANEITNIRERLIQLLDELVFNTDDVSQAHIAFQTSGFIPESEQSIFHYAMQFDWIFRRDSEATAIEGR